jgi:hypothetical protein
VSVCVCVCAGMMRVQTYSETLTIRQPCWWVRYDVPMPAIVRRLQYFAYNFLSRCVCVQQAMSGSGWQLRKENHKVMR